MANKLKTVVTVNADNYQPNIELILTDAQAVEVLQQLVTGNTLLINLVTKTNGQVKEDPAAYAVE